MTCGMTHNCSSACLSVVNWDVLERSDLFKTPMFSEFSEMRDESIGWSFYCHQTRTLKPPFYSCYPTDVLGTPIAVKEDPNYKIERSSASGKILRYRVCRNDERLEKGLMSKWCKTYANNDPDRHDECFGAYRDVLLYGPDADCTTGVIIDAVE